MLVNLQEILEPARKNGFAVGAFNTSDLALVRAVTEQAEASNTPAILQFAPGEFKYATPDFFKYVRERVRNSPVPFAIHLDHGKSFEDVKRCVDAGFTSVMVDASEYGFEDNIRAVRRAAEYCHFYHIPVEAELGAIRGKEDDNCSEADCKTDPALVAEFADRSGCDTLAVSIGNVHGLEEAPKIDLPLLKEIAKVSPVPLVLHGGSGISFELIRNMKTYKMLKINYGSDLRQAYIKTFGKAYEVNHKEADLYGLSMKAVKNVRQTACDLVRIINGFEEG